MKLFQVVILTLLALMLAFQDKVGKEAWLQEGDNIESKDFTEVVKVKSSKGSCLATLVGPQVAITSASCATDKEEVTLVTDYSSFSGRFEVSNLETKHLAAIILQDFIPYNMIHFATVSGISTYGMELSIFGADCEDDSLRKGSITVSGFTKETGLGSNSDGMFCVSNYGPVYLPGITRIHYMVGFLLKESKDGHIFFRMDTPASRKFLWDISTKYKLEICGISEDCGAGTLLNPCSL